MNPVDAGYETDKVVQIESNLDDVSAEIIGHVTGVLMDAGALDVWTTPIQMKKQRPGTLLSVLCEQPKAELIIGLLFSNTSAFGVRTTEMVRWKLRRDFIEVQTPFGPITVKRGFRKETLIQTAPEFESCKAAALRHGCPLQAVYDAARLAIHRQSIDGVR